MRNMVLRTAGVLLCMTGVVKLISAFGSARVLQTTDGVFGVRNDLLFAVVGVIEILLGVTIARKRDALCRSVCLWGISACFVIYRFGLWWLGDNAPCHCLGNVTDWLSLNRRTEDILTGEYLPIFWFVVYLCCLRRAVVF